MKRIMNITNILLISSYHRYVGIFGNGELAESVVIPKNGVKFRKAQLPGRINIDIVSL